VSKTSRSRVANLDRFNPPVASHAHSVGILVCSCESALVQDNVIKLDGQAQPIKHFYTNGVKTSGNMTPDGELLLSYNGETGANTDDLELKIRDDLEELGLLALLKA
jgi:hypothetical protein